MKHLKDTDLDFLQYLDSKDLDILVEILITPKTEALTKKDIYIEFKNEHNIYWEEIVKELQYFGGNSIANTARGEGVKYFDILKDVCKAFDIKTEFENPMLDFDNTLMSKFVTKAFDKITKSNEKRVWRLEEELLDKFSKDDIDKAIQKCNPKNKMKSKDLLLTLLPYGIPQLILKRLSDPNFQVTTKAVYEIAKLREKYDSQSQILALECSKNKNLELVYSQSISIVDDEEVNAGELKVVDPTSITDIDFIETTDNEINNLNQLLADTIKTVATAPSQTVELVFSAKVQKELAKINGKYKRTIDSAIARNRNGTIKEHGKIIQNSQIKQLLTGGYQLLSIAVAQSHLADIEKSLSSIRGLVKNIQDKLEAEDIANIKGAIRYLENQIVPFIKNNSKNEMSQEHKNELQSIIRGIYTWEGKILEEYNILNKEIQQLNSKDTFGTGNTYEELKILLKRIEPLKKRYGLILKLSNVLNIVQKIIYFNDNNVLNIDIQLESFKNLIEKYNIFLDAKKETLLDSNFNKSNTLTERKKFIEILQKRQNNDFEQLTLEYQKQAQSIDEYFESFKNGKASILLSFDEESQIDKYAINFN